MFRTFIASIDTNKPVVVKPIKETFTKKSDFGSIFFKEKKPDLQDTNVRTLIFFLYAYTQLTYIKQIYTYLIYTTTKYNIVFLFTFFCIIFLIIKKIGPHQTKKKCVHYPVVLQQSLPTFCCYIFLLFLLAIPLYCFHNYCNKTRNVLKNLYVFFFL